MKNLLLLLALLLVTAILSAQVITENFDSGMPAGWRGETSYGFDFVTENGGKIDLFKQSDTDDPLLLITEEYDLSLYTRLEIDVSGFNLSFVNPSIPQLHVGHFHPNSDCCFEPIHTIFVPNNSPEVLVLDIASVSITTSLVFKLEGDASHIIYLDNFKLYNEVYENNIPAAVEALSLTPRLSVEPGFSQSSWISPKNEADGDLLPNLTAIDFINLRDNSLTYSFDNPLPGENYMPEIDIDGPAGYYQFEVFARNDAGKGYVRFTDTYWLGLDRPGEASGLTATKSGDNILLEWTAPTTGANSEQSNGSYFDNIVESYTVVRSDGKEFVIPGDETTFTDVLDIQGSITYTLIPENSSGQGTPTTSNIIYRVEDDLLYYEDFYVDVVERPDETLDYDHKWTTQSTTPNAFWSHFFSSFAGDDAGELAYLWGGNSNINSVRAVSPIINTAGFPAISIEYNHSIEFPANPTFSILLETTSDGGVTWNEAALWQETTTVNEQVIKTIGNSDVGSENFQFAISVLGNASYANFARFDNFRVYYQPSVDLIALEADMTNRSEPGDGVELFGVVENGSTEIVSGTATCTLKERYGTAILETYTEGINDLGIGEIRNINFGTWTGIEGEYIIEITLENAEDQQLENNSYTHQLDVLQLVSKDLVLIEEFTGTWCAYCPGAALGIHDLMTEGEPVVAVAYHRNDDYETPTTQAKMDLYNILGFPSVVFDGVIKNAGGHVSQSIVASYRPFVEELKQVRVPLKVDFYGSIIKDDRYEAWVDVSAASNILNPNYILRLALIEDGIAEDWQGLDVLDLVEKGYFEAELDLSDNGFDRKFIKLTLPLGMDPMNSHAVVWVQNTETNEVFNAATISLVDFMVANQKVIETDIKLFPNPASDMLIVEGDGQSYRYKIHGTDGKFFQNGKLDEYQTKLNINLLPTGMYYMHITNQDDNKTSYLRFLKG